MPALLSIKGFKYYLAAAVSQLLGSEESLKLRTAGEIVEDCMRDYGNAVVRFAYTYVHNMADAEDVLQDTLIKIYRAAPKFENKAHEKAYVFQVAANTARNRIKYNKIRETDELNEELAGENREDLSYLWDAVKALPVKYREVVHLFYEEDMPTAAIAKALGRRESSVRSDLTRARQKLKEILKEDYDFE